MVEKQDSLNKIRESNKKIVEWWKKFWRWIKNVGWGTVKSIFYTLKSASESWVSKVYKNKSENLDLSDESREKYKNKSKKYSNKSKESIIKAWKWVKQWIKWTWEILSWGIKVAWNSLAAWYHGINYTDKKLWQAIEKRQKEKWKNNVSKVWRFFANHAISWSLAMVLLWAWWTAVLEHNINKPEGRKSGIKNHIEAKWNSSDTLLIPAQRYDAINSIEAKWNSNDTLLIPTQGYGLLNNTKQHAPLTRLYLWWNLVKSWYVNVWDTLVLNPAKSLHNLWSEKIRKYGHSTKDITKLDEINVESMSPEDIENFRIKYPIDATYLFVVKPYIDWKENRETMSLEEFVKQTNKIIVETRKLTNDYDGWLKWYKKELFDSIRNDITWECIVAYAMTELCENKKNWELNKELFDILLRNSGANYLSNIPAIYDWKTSYWFYQFTEYALYDRNWEKRWASVVNKVLPKDKKISWSVIDLRTREDQTKAAYMFALYNINTAIKKLTDNQAKDLLSYKRKHKESFKDNMTQLIAMCHHMPAAWISLKKWHEDKYKSDIFNYWGKHTKPYWESSKTNYEALKN